MHGPRHADDEGEDGYNDEHHDRTGIQQFGQVSPADGLIFHSPGNFLHPLYKVLNAIGGNVQQIIGPTQPFRVI